MKTWPRSLRVVSYRSYVLTLCLLYAVFLLCLDIFFGKGFSVALFLFWWAPLSSLALMRLAVFGNAPLGSCEELLLMPRTRWQKFVATVSPWDFIVLLPCLNLVKPLFFAES